jgi:hypothetical protein
MARRWPKPRDRNAEWSRHRLKFDLQIVAIAQVNNVRRPLRAEGEGWRYLTTRCTGEHEGPARVPALARTRSVRPRRPPKREAPLPSGLSGDRVARSIREPGWIALKPSLEL